MLCSLWKLPTVCLYNIFKCLINFKDCTSMHEYFSNRFVCLALYSTQWTLAVAHKCVIICSCMIKIIVLLAVYITGSTRPMENNNNNKNIDIVLRKKNFCDYNPFLHWAYEKFERKKIRCVSTACRLLLRAFITDSGASKEKQFRKQAAW